MKRSLIALICAAALLLPGMAFAQGKVCGLKNGCSCACGCERSGECKCKADCSQAGKCGCQQKACDCKKDKK